jgi:multidrug resistance efflux pump
LQASLAGAKQQTEILKSNYDQATANVAGLTTQVAYNKKRLADIPLAADDPSTQFQAQDKQVQYETVSAQLGAAKAAQQGAKLALDSEIGGINTTVAQLQAQLDNAKWELSQTAVRAPADGYATVVALTVGDRALQARSAMSFIVENEMTLVGISGSATAFAGNAGVIGLLASILVWVSSYRHISSQPRFHSFASRPCCPNTGSIVGSRCGIVFSSLA